MGCCANERKQARPEQNQKSLGDEELEKRVNELFSKYDKDGSGALDPKETMNLLNDILKDHNQTVSERQVRNFIVATDKNHDGLLQKNQIAGLYRKLMAK